MGVIGIASTELQDATNGTILGLGAQIEAAHDAAHVVTSAILPPTNDSASGTAVIQELGNIAEFSAMLKAGLLELVKANGVISANNHVAQAIDAAGAAGTAAINS